VTGLNLPFSIGFCRRQYNTLALPCEYNNNNNEHICIAQNKNPQMRYDGEKFVTIDTLITGSIARSAKRRYLIYSEADFEVFRPAGATRCTDGGEIWHGGTPIKYNSLQCCEYGDT